MKARILRELKSSFLLFLWLLLMQTAADLLLAVAAALGLLLAALGVFPLVGRTPLWVWIALSVPVCLSWLAMGWLAPRAVRPGPAETAVVLTVWSVLASLMSSVYFLFLAQKVCGGMLEQILRSLGHDAWSAEKLALTAACFLLSTVLGMGLLWGRKHTAAAG